MRLLVFVILLAVHLSAHGQCTIVPFSVPVGCTSTSCPSASRIYHLWSPIIYVGCGEREYLTITVDVDYNFIHSYLVSIGSSLTLDGVVSLVNAKTQRIQLYAEDQYGDMSLTGTGDFNGQSSKDFTVHGSTNYMFTFDNSAITGFKLTTSPLPYCKLPFGSEKILKADDVNSAQYQCSLYIDSVEQSIVQTHGLNGCTHYRCQYYADKKTVAFCESTLSDDECYNKAEYVWFIGTEFDLSSLPKIIIYCFLIFIYFLGLGHGLRT